MDASSLLQRFASAKAKRSVWESHWQECYDYALPHGGGFNRAGNPGERKTDRLFDGTAADAVEQLSASLLAQLTPPWSRWFGLTPGPGATHEIIQPEERACSRHSRRPACDAPAC